MQTVTPETFIATLREMHSAYHAQKPDKASARKLAIRYMAQPIIEREGGQVTVSDLAKEIGVSPITVGRLITDTQRRHIRHALKDETVWGPLHEGFFAERRLNSASAHHLGVSISAGGSEE